MSDHGLEKYMSPNAGTVDAASGNVGKPKVEQTKEGAPRKPVSPALAVPLVNGKPLGAESLPPSPASMFASIMAKDLK